MLKRNESLFLTTGPSFLTASFIAILFSYWFAGMQLKVISADAISSYPAHYFVITWIKCSLTILVFFILSRLILSRISAGKINPFYIALSYLPLLLTYVNCSMPLIAGLIILTQTGLLVTVLQKDDYKRMTSAYLGDTAVLFLFFLCHFLLTTRFSPLHWNAAILTARGYNSEELHVVAPIFQGYLLAKQFVFSNFDHAQWAGIMHPPVTLASPYMQLTEFILDLPSVSYESFHVILSAIYFSLMILGSFGFYLFLKYAARVNSLFAFFGGYLFMFSGNPLLSQIFTGDGGIFLAPLVVFPYALLCISCAFSKNDYRFSLWAGLALASQFFFLAPHPEGTIYSLFFYCIFTLGLFLFSRQLRWGKKFVLSAISVAAFFSLSAFYMVPILVDQIQGNMFVFAHTNDISSSYLFYSYFKPYVILLSLFAPLSFISLLIYKKLTPIYLSSLFLSLILLVCMFSILDANLIAQLVHFLHMGIHFWVPSRIGVYFYCSVFIISIYGLDITARIIFDFIRKRRLFI